MPSRESWKAVEVFENVNHASEVSRPRTVSFLIKHTGFACINGSKLTVISVCDRLIVLFVTSLLLGVSISPL
jgi:hypothetical protein